jgi:hypothetical protein
MPDHEPMEDTHVIKYLKNQGRVGVVSIFRRTSGPRAIPQVLAFGLESPIRITKKMATAQSTLSSRS